MKPLEEKELEHALQRAKEVLGQSPLKILYRTQRGRQNNTFMRKLGVSEPETHRLIAKTDKYRADYYKYYTGGHEWMNPVNYDLTLNSDRVGCEECVNLLNWYCKEKFHL